MNSPSWRHVLRGTYGRIRGQGGVLMTGLPPISWPNCAYVGGRFENYQLHMGLGRRDSPTCSAEIFLKDKRSSRERSASRRARFGPVAMPSNQPKRERCRERRLVENIAGRAGRIRHSGNRRGCNAFKCRRRGRHVRSGGPVRDRCPHSQVPKRRTEGTCER